MKRNGQGSGRAASRALRLDRRSERGAQLRRQRGRDNGRQRPRLMHGRPVRPGLGRIEAGGMAAAVREVEQDMQGS